MLAYAANRPVIGKAQSSPNALLIVVSVHVAVVAAVMSAKMDLPAKLHHGTIQIIDLPTDPPPPAPNPIAEPLRQPSSTSIDRTKTLVDVPPNSDTDVDPGPSIVDPGPVIGAGTSVTATIPDPAIAPIHHDPRLLTPPSQLKPPYPASKLLTEEEATLTLRLSIDSDGRVAAVEPVGRADRDFLDAARWHLMARWRYQPATDDGRAVASSITVTLRFRLDG